MTDVTSQKFTIKTKLSPNDELEDLQHKCIYEINFFNVQKTVHIITQTIKKKRVNVSFIHIKYIKYEIYNICYIL